MSIIGDGPSSPRPSACYKESSPFSYSRLMWWNRATELVTGFANNIGGRRHSEDDLEYADGEEGSWLPVVIRPHEVEFIRKRTGMKVRDILAKLTNKHSFGLILLKRDIFNRVLGRRILDGSELVEELPVNWSATRAEESNICLVDLSQEVTVFLNTYFRLATGCPTHIQRLYIRPGMTVADFEEELKDSLSIPIGDMRMGLYGHERNQVIPLDGDLLMSELREREEDMENPSFFQLQFHQESESDSFLGSTRSSNLFMRANRGTRKLKKCWFSLQGTTLFYRPSQTDHGWVKKIERIDQCKIVYRGANKAKDSWRFDLIPADGNGPIRVFSSPLKRRIVRWVRELRGAHRTLEINEPVTMVKLRETLPAKDIEPASHYHKVSADQTLTQVPFYQRKLLELAEAHLSKVEQDGGVLALNGLDGGLDEALARKWVENVRELIHHCMGMRATNSAKKVVKQAKELLKRLREWVQYLESTPEELEDESIQVPNEDSLKMVIEDATQVVNFYRHYVISMEQEEERIVSERERLPLEETLETMQDALKASLFSGRGRRPVVVRGMFRPAEEVEAARKREEAKKRAEVEREKRRMERRKNPQAAVWTILDQSQNRADNEASEESSKKQGWLSRKLARIFRKRKMVRNPYAIDDEEEDFGADDDDDSISGAENMEERDRKWNEAMNLLTDKKDKSKRLDPEHDLEEVAEELSPIRARTREVMRDAEPEVRSGFSRLNLNRSSSLQMKKAELEDPSRWTVPSTEPNKTSSHPAEPFRAGPEEEVLLLRMLKDPRVKELLQEYREERTEQVNAAEPNTAAAVAAWGMRRQGAAM